MGGINEPSLKDYKNVFEKFRKYLKDIHDNNGNQSITHEGYFVNYKKFEDFKDKLKILFQKEPDNLNSLNPNEEKRIFGEIETIKIETESLDEVKKDIGNNKFIIINKDTHKLICKKPEPEKEDRMVQYKLSNDFLIVNPGKNDEIQFKKNKENIVDKTSFIEKNYNDINNTTTDNSIKEPKISHKDVDNIYKDVKNFYENENSVLNKLKGSQPQKFNGYLVNKEWVDDWKKLSYYDNIKNNNLLLKTMENKEIEIKNLILEQARNKSNYHEIKAVENYIINVNQIQELSQKDKCHYYLLDENFLNAFIKNKDIKPTQFLIHNQTLSTSLSEQKDLIIKADNNSIINIKNIDVKNKIYCSENLKHLMRYPYFKQELIKMTKSPKNEFKSAFIINKNIIKKFNEIYNLKEIYNLLKKDLEGINYQNCDENYIQIYKHLNSIKKDYIDNFEQIEKPGQIKLNEIENKFEIKSLNNEPNLGYVDNFGIIDEKYSAFLNKKFGDDLHIFPIYYAALKEEKIFLVIYIYQQYFYEIISFSPEGRNVIVEYLLEITNKETIPANDKILFDNKILQILSNTGVSKLISEGKSIPIENNTSMKIHPVNELLRASLNRNNNIYSNNFENKGINQYNIYKNNGNEQINHEIPIIINQPNQTKLPKNNLLFQSQIQGVIPNNINRTAVVNPIIPLNNYQQIQNRTVMKHSLSKSQVQGELSNIGKEIKKENNITSVHERYYLINKEILHPSKELNHYNSINSINGQIFYNMNLTTNGNIPNSNYNIKTQQFPFNNQNYIFPIDFRIINQNHFNTIPILLNDKTNKILFEEV